MSAQNEVDGPPVDPLSGVVVTITCPNNSSGVISTACLKGTMKGGGDGKFPLKGIDRWHNIDWMFDVTDGDTDTDGDGREIMLLNLNICLRVVPALSADFKSQLEKGVSFYLSQMVNAKTDKYSLCVTGGFYEKLKCSNSD